MPYQFTRDAGGGPPHVRFNSPQEFVQYIEDLQAGRHPGITADPASIRQADAIRRNPEGWEMDGWHPRQRPDWLARNLPWLGPTVIGAAIGGPALVSAFGGGGGAAGGAGGASGATAGNLGLGGAATTTAVPSSVMGMGLGPGAYSAAATAPAAYSAGSSLLSRVLTGLRNYGPLGLAGLGAARGLTQGETDAERQLEDIMQMAKGRIDATQPLFNSLNTMATRQMPRYTREG